MHGGAKERHFQIAKDWYNNVKVKVTFIQHSPISHWLVSKGAQPCNTWSPSPPFFGCHVTLRCVTSKKRLLGRLCKTCLSSYLQTTCSLSFLLVRAKHARDKNDHACAELKATHDRAFSHDVTAAILVSQNNETAATLVSQTNPVGVEFFSYVNAFFSSNKFQRCWPRESYFQNYINCLSLALGLSCGMRYPVTSDISPRINSKNTLQITC